MKFIISIKRLTAILLLFGATACGKSYLELDSRYTAAKDAIKDLNSMSAALNGAYSLLQSDNYYGRSFIVIPELISDNGMISIVHSSRYTNINANTTVSTDSYVTGLWNQLYSLVVNCNLLIQEGGKLQFPVNDEKAGKDRLAESYALRALANFDLVRAFAQPYNNTADASHPGVPLVTESGTEVKDIRKPPRASVADVYAQIVADCLKAIELFEQGTGTIKSTRFNVYGAKALLSKVYLYMGDWPNAEEFANDVIEDGGYALLTNANLVNNFKVKGNSEAIFEIANNTADNLGTNSLANFYSQLGYGDIIATENLYNIYSATDVRRQFVARSKRNRVGGEDPAYIISKYGNIVDFEENTKVLRLAEIILIRAEARAKQTGKETLAQADYLAVAKRGDVNVLPTTSTGNELVNIILRERRKELAFEGNQLFDLNRSKLNWTKYRSGAADITFTAQSNRTILPIPRRETNLNPNISQNPGFGL